MPIDARQKADNTNESELLSKRIRETELRAVLLVLQGRDIEQPRESQVFVQGRRRSVRLFEHSVRELRVVWSLRGPRRLIARTQHAACSNYAMR